MRFWRRRPRPVIPVCTAEPYSDEWLEHQCRWHPMLVVRAGAAHTLAKRAERRCQEDMIRRVVREEVAAPDWQPIETAPTDGRAILVYAAQPKHDGFWNGMHVAVYDAKLSGNSWGHHWRTADYQGLGDGISGRPTHWMPLPAQPTEGQS